VSAATGFRVIARVRSERGFKRTELRSAVIETVRRWRPRWRVEDPADLEIWVLESRKGRFRASMRLSTAEMRTHGGRAVEFAGALRPTVAAALVRATGRPAGLLIDPFCGSGTVVGEARQVGWKVFGSDVDPAAIEIARANEPGVNIVLATADDLPVADAAAAAVATNPPFGVQHGPRTLGRPLDEWWRANLAEFARVVQTGGRIVLLHPEDELLAAAVRATPVLREEGRTAIRTLGQQAAIWTLRRA
jgi:tRNA (guanine10-N2)-dimethyltransferase